MKTEKYIDFSLDYDGKCENIDEYYVGDENKTNEVNFSDVDKFIKKLSEEVDEFLVSDHRTEVRIWWYDNNTMDVLFRYYNEPEWDEFDDYELNVPSIEF